MRLIRILNKSIRDSFKSIFRNFSLSLASISCTIITLLLVSLALLVTENITDITKKIEHDLTIVVFVDNNASDEEIENINKSIKDIDNVETITYRTKNEIKETMSNENESFKTIMDSWSDDENPLQSTYILKVKNIKKIKETASTIKNLDKVTMVKYGETMVDRMINVFDIVKKCCWIVVLALVFVTIFLMTNTIKITIFSRRNEINIMRLVGTSNTVIKLPYLFEGLLLGIFGSLFPILLTIFGYSYFYDVMGGVVLSNLVELTKPSQIIFNISVILLIIGGIVGMFASVKAVRKYLKI